MDAVLCFVTHVCLSEQFSKVQRRAFPFMNFDPCSDPSINGCDEKCCSKYSTKWRQRTLFETHVHGGTRCKRSLQHGSLETCFHKILLIVALYLSFYRVFIDIFEKFALHCLSVLLRSKMNVVHSLSNVRLESIKKLFTYFILHFHLYQSRTFANAQLPVVIDHHQYQVPHFYLEIAMVGWIFLRLAVRKAFKLNNSFSCLWQ